MRFWDLYDVPLGLLIGTVAAMPVLAVIVICERFFPYTNSWSLPSRVKNNAWRP